MNEGQGQARAWFEGLEQIDGEEALSILDPADPVACAHGSIRSTLSHDHVIRLMETHGARRAPERQAPGLDHFGLVTIDDDGFPVHIRTVPDPVLLCIMPTGWWWSDRTREEDGDYVQLAFLSFSKLELEIFSSCPERLRQRIERKAAEFQALEGQDYRISTSGQTIRLGHALQR